MELALIFAGYNISFKIGAGDELTKDVSRARGTRGFRYSRHYLLPALFVQLGGYVWQLALSCVHSGITQTTPHEHREVSQKLMEMTDSVRE